MRRSPFLGNQKSISFFCYLCKDTASASSSFKVYRRPNVALVVFLIESYVCLVAADAMCIPRLQGI
jgi:hypothetical protein